MNPRRNDHGHRRRNRRPYLAQGENRVVIRGVGWQGYQTLLSLVGESAGPLDVRPGRRGTDVAAFQARTEQVTAWPDGRDPDRGTRHSVDIGWEQQLSSERTSIGDWKRTSPFYLGDLSRSGDADNLDLEVDPPPDLAIEIEITRSVLNRLGDLRSPRGSRDLEIRWSDAANPAAPGRWNLSRDSPRSEALPWISIEEIARFVQLEETRDDTLWARTFRAWVRQVVLPRLGQADEDGLGTPSARS